MPDPRERTAELLDDRPELREPLREMLAVDAEGDPWEFDDVPLDSGNFGEVVSRGIVEQSGDGYRVADRDAVRAALDGEAAVEDDSGSSTGGGTAGTVPDVAFDPAELVADLDRRSAAVVAAALSVLAAFRLVPYPAVFRNGDVVLYPNDPYLYRYWVDRLTARAGGPLDLGVIAGLPESVANGEPLLVAMAWWFAELLGGGAFGSGVVLAVYPVVAGVVTGLVVYLLGERVADPRVGAAGVVMLAVTPVHAVRTGLGFGDHHALDYVFLAVTALALVALVAPRRGSAGTGDEGAGATGTGATGDSTPATGDDPRSLPEIGSPLAVGLLGVGVAGSTLAWEAGPLMVLPVAAVGALLALSVHRTGRSPLSAGAGIVAGVGSGAAMTALAHVGLGWQATAVAVSPALLAVGLAAVFALAEVAGRRSVSTRALAGLEAGVAVVAVAAAGVVVPSLLAELGSRVDFLLGTTGITEAASIIGGQFGALGPLLLFGPVPLLAVPYLAWATRRAYRGHHPAWLVLSVYTWFFLALSLLQARFGGQLAVFSAVFAGLGFVHVASWVDAARVPAPFAGEDGPAVADGGDDPAFVWPGTNVVAYLAVFAAIISVTGLVMTPAFLDSATIDDARYGAADRARSYAEQRGIDAPRSYVLSEWTYNRMYNYFVNGDSESYAFARANYPRFVASTDGERTYSRLRGRVGFVVIGRSDAELPNGSLHSRLTTAYGSRHNGTPGLAHYRVIWESDDGRILLVRLVPGARIRGRGAPNATLDVSTTVDVGGRNVSYSRRVRTGEDGRFAVTVPYPGQYAVGNRTVRVGEGAVENGSTVRVPSPAGSARFVRRVARTPRTGARG